VKYSFIFVPWILSNEVNMPASVYSDMNTNSQLMEDQRALQLAFELSLLGINGDEDAAPANNGNLSPQSFAEEQAKRRSANMTECVPVPSSEHVAEIVGRQGNNPRHAVWALFTYFLFRNARGIWRFQSAKHVRD